MLSNQAIGKYSISFFSSMLICFLAFSGCTPLSKRIPPKTTSLNIPCRQSCDDMNPCTDDVCSNGVCENIDNTSPCDDNIPCSENDRCTKGKCVGEAIIRTLYVGEENCSDNKEENPCLGSEQQPYCTIQKAIDIAPHNCEIIVRAKKDNKPYRENLHFDGRKTVTVRSESGPKATVIDGDSDGDGIGNKAAVQFNKGSRSSLIGFGITNAPRCETSASGGIDIFNSSPTISNCIISGLNCNKSGSGGGIYSYSSSPTISNCIISGNQAGWGGGVCFVSSSPTISNCTIADNTASWNGGGIYSSLSSLRVVNSILWGNSIKGKGDQIFLLKDTGTINITYSNIQGGYEGEGNKAENPLFVDSANGNYHLQPGSPCIDKGTGDTDKYPGLPSNDIDGDPRPWGSDEETAIHDMGADEFIIAK